MNPYSKTEITELFAEFLKKNRFSEKQISQIDGKWVLSIFRTQTHYFRCCDASNNSVLRSVLLNEENLDKVILESMRVARSEILKAIGTEKRLLEKK